MRINFISYLDPFIHGGGGEQITRKLIEVGESRGHEIFRVHQNPSFNNYKYGANLNIFWDVWNAPELGNAFPEEDIFTTMDKVPYIYGTGGYEDICSLGTLPCEGFTHGNECKVEKSHPTFSAGGIGRPHPGGCPANRRSRLLKDARMCIFFSELHQRKIEQVLGQSLNSFIAVPPIKDIERFFDSGGVRDIEYLSYGGHLEYKGFNNIRNALPQARDSMIFIGGGDAALPRIHQYGQHMGTVPFDYMPELLNRVKNFVHMPRWPEPFGMTTIQAFLCGCNIIENENSVAVGNRSKEELIELVNEHKNCIPMWEAIESCVSA